MKTEDIVKRLEALLADIKGHQPVQGGETQPQFKGKEEPPAGWKRALVTFWSVEEKQNDRGTYTAARVGLAWIEPDGERQSCFLSTFDKSLIMKLDPLQKGSRVEYRTDRDKSGREKLADLVVTGAPGR